LLNFFSFFQKIDEKIFALINDWKSKDSYQQINQKIMSLEDQQQKLITKSLFMTFTLLPLATALILLVFVFAKSSRIADKEDLLTLSDHQLVIAKQFERFSSEMIAQISVSSDDEIKSSLSQSPVAHLQRKLNFNSFVQTPVGGSYGANSLNLKFSQISTPDLATLTRYFYENFRIRILGANIERNNTNKLLNGELSLHFYSTL